MKLFEDSPAIYDFVTGEYKEHTKVEPDAESKAIDALMQMEGFSIFKTYLSHTIDGLKERLVFARDTSDIIRFQEAIKAYQNVLSWFSWKSTKDNIGNTMPYKENNNG